jgi:GNAT superfamily N-acetyltransferase
MLKLLRTNSKNRDFINLVEALDADLAKRDGEEHSFYHQFNSIANLDYTIVLYESKIPVGCGAIKSFDNTTMEIKRMYIPQSYRGKGFATKILSALELWTSELGNLRCILETGKRQPEAIALYKKNGYKIISNYGKYDGIDNSICFEKRVSF